MERFLERISVSSYREKFVLKGGLLIASFFGLDMRSTMDIDSTMRSLPLNLESSAKAVKEIIETPIEDQVKFNFSKGSPIMQEHGYPGIRFPLQGSFDRIRQTIRIDLSTGDVITPSAIKYSYSLMFEDRHIELMTYNLETVIAEKFETIIARGTANTRMRDFYDVFLMAKQGNFALPTLKRALVNTVIKRNSEPQLKNYSQIMQEIASSSILAAAWDGFTRQSYFAGDLSWEEVLKENIVLIENVMKNNSIVMD